MPIVNALSLPWRVERDFYIVNCDDCQIAFIDSGDATQDEEIAQAIIARMNAR